MSKHAVLICDDEEGIRESFRLILGDHYDLTFAESGQEALKLVKTLSFDLMLLDIKMPKKHGIEVLKEIKAHSPQLPVVIVTGYQSAEMAQEAMKNGAADYLPKPFLPQQILAIAAKYVR